MSHPYLFPFLFLPCLALAIPSVRNRWRLQFSSFLLALVNARPSPLRSRFLLLFLLIDPSLNPPLMRMVKLSFSRLCLLSDLSFPFISRSLVLSCWLCGFFPRIGFLDSESSVDDQG